jgi:hypothetical protein
LAVESASVLKTASGMKLVLPMEWPTGCRLASAWPNRLEWGLVIQKESDSAPRSVSPTGLAR